MKIERNFKKFLQILANNELKNNLLARVVANYYDKIQNLDDKIKFYNQIEPFYQNHLGFENLPEFSIIDKNDEDIFFEKDFRIKSVRLNCLRGFPEKNDYPFGFDLVNEKNDYSNAVILGPNASGKSSIYSALEFIYTNEIGEKKLRTFENKKLSIRDYTNYLQHFNYDYNKSMCRINTKENEYSLTNPIFEDNDSKKYCNPETHFISEYDIISNGKLKYDSDEDSFHNLIADRLGLREYLQFKNLIINLSKYGRNTEKNKIKDRNKDLEKNLKSVKDIKEERSEYKRKLEELYDSLKKEEEAKDTVRDSQIKKIKDRMSIDFNITFEGDELINQFNEYEELYAKLNSLLISEINKEEIQFLSTGLTLLGERDNCPFCMDSKKSLEKIKEDVIIRIESGKEYLTIFSKMNEIYKSILSSLDYLYSLINTISNIIEEDLKDLPQFDGFKDLLEDEKQILDNIKRLQSPHIIENFNTFDKSLNLNNISIDKFYEYLSENIIHYSDYITQIIDPIKKRIDKVRRHNLIYYVEKLQVEDNYANIQNQILFIESQIKSSLENLERIEIDNKSINEDIEKEKFKIENIVKKIKEEAEEYSKVLEIKIGEILKDSIEPIKSTFERILKNYIEVKSDINLEIDFKPKNDNIIEDEVSPEILTAKIVFIDKNTGESMMVTPNKYFNTFDYKLFCMVVALSIAVASRIVTRVNLPVILDDVFYSSDYQHRTEFIKFLQNIFNLFETNTPDLPLQLILFTNDNLIFDTSVDAIRDYEIFMEKTKDDSIEKLQDKTIFARLFPPNELDKSPADKEGDKYWDILFKLPSKLPESIINEKQI